ncbi:MAG: glucose-1-phosphate thymidylyltransferase, partial [Chitinophagaceae bacterium]|nr:glucose-1-phosphate thymidylyltransferase [Chitinophagaceae bacterium]
MNDELFPFTLTRPMQDIRVGILTIKEKQAAYLKANPQIISYPWDIFLVNDREIREDFKTITTGRQSASIPATVQTVNPGNIFIEEGTTLSHCIINAENGPVYIGKNAEIMEGSLIRGPFALCERGVVKMGTKIYGATTVGPYSIVGGEIKNSVIFGYSNKAHDGYLGDSVIGEWCNLGAGTSNSNLKNTAADIRIWSNGQNDFVNAGINKCGLIMGDYSRAAINTSFNTGTVVGVCCNIFGTGLTPKFIPSFSWGADAVQKYDFDRAMKDIANWKKLKKHDLTEQEKT